MTGTADPIDVLHVDDEPDFADLAAELLQRADDRLTVHTATHPDDGFELLADRNIDCVVSDYDMPGRNGIEFLEAVRDRYPNLPFILYTGKGSEEVASDAISAGVTDYLQKGTGTDQYDLLANRIRNAVSARRAAVDAEQRRHRLGQILKTVPSCVVQLDHEGRFVFANDRAVAVLGLTESALTNRTYNDPEWNITDLDGDPIPEPDLPFRRVRDSGDPLYGFRHTIEWPDGSKKILSVNGAPLFDADGSVESVVFSLSDITERVERERDLEATTNRLEALFENSPDMIDIHSGDGTVVDVNRRFCEVFDRPKDELVGRKVWEIDQQIDPEEIRDIWAEMEVGDRHELETEFVRPDGEQFPAEVHLTRLPEDDGEDRFVVISRDISDRRRRERRLEEFASVVSHDLRNPLNVAQGSVELAAAERTSDHLDRAARAHERMADLIDDLLTLARRGDAVADPEPIEMRSFAETCWQHVATGDATLRVAGDRTIHADPGRLRQLFENLMRNAVEHGYTTPRAEGREDPVEHRSTDGRTVSGDADEHATVTVGTLPDGFYVEDDGPGIPTDDREAIFESGYSTTSGGTGFGLTIVTQIADDHGWTVEATEGPDGGARFEVTGVESGG